MNIEEGGGGGGAPTAAIGGGAAVAILLMVGLGFLYLRKKRMAGSQSPVALTAISLTPTKAPESLAALLAACGLEHHASAFEAEGYTLDTLLDAVKHGVRRRPCATSASSS